MESILKYPGAKNRLAKWLLSFVPEHNVYLELFFGSGAVFFNKVPAKIETINDIDGEVFNLFKTIRDFPDELAKLVEMTPYSREEYGQAFDIRPDTDSIEQARKFLVRCWLGMGSSNVYKNGFRSSQQSSSPRTTKHWREIPDRILQAADRLKMAQIEKLDALELIWEYTGEKRGRCVCKVKEETETACYKRAIEMLESYSRKDTVKHEKKAG